MNKKIIVVVALSFILLLNSAPPTLANQLDNAITQQGNVQDQKDQLQGKLNELTFTANKIKGQLTDLNNQMAQAQKDLKEKQEARAKAQAQLLTAQKELTAKQKEADLKRQVLASRLRTIYEDTPVSYIDVLFQANDFNDLLTRFEYFSRLIQSDQNLLAETRSVVQEVDDRTKELQVIQNQAVQLEAQAQAAKSELDNKHQQQQELLDQVKKEQEEDWAEIEKLAAQEKVWQTKIRQLQTANKTGVKGTISTWPLPGYYEISSPFGWRTNPVTGKRGQHLGIDTGSDRN